MAVLKNRAKMSTSTTGTGTITLGSAESGYQTFADAGVANADVVRYVIEDGNNWEIGTGTYTATGTTLSRTVSESSNADAAINLSGSATVFIGATAEDIPALDYTLESKTANYTVVSGDLGKIISFSGNLYTVSLTAASSLGSGFHVTIWNLGAFAIHTVTIDPNSTETIDGKTTLVLGQGEGVEIVCDGSNWQTNDKKAMRLYAETATEDGTRPVASGSNAIAIGNIATSSGENSIAIGLLSNATSTRAVALGSYAQAVTGSYATAISRAYASGADSIAAAIANNTSSYGATGPNSIAIGSQAKATAADAVAIGDRNVASGNGSVALAARSTASGNNSVSIGFLSDATGASSVALGSGYSFSGPQATFYNSIAIGQGSLSDKIGKVAISGFAFSSSGDGQHGIFVLRVATTNATATPLITGPDYFASYTPDDENQIVLPNNSAFAFHGTIVARQQAADGTACAAWKVEGLIRREGSAGTTTLVNSATTVLDNTPSWGLALSADTTNGALKVTATGAAATNIRWVATIHTSEVTYA